MTSSATHDDGVITTIPDLDIEAAHREDLVIVEQRDYSGETERIALHVSQVRILAEHLGLLPPVDQSAQQHLKTIATLARRLRVLHERIDHLGHYLHHHSDTEHANMDYEQVYAHATCELADEFIADLDDLTGVVVVASLPGPKPATVIADTGSAPSPVAPMQQEIDA